MKIRDIFPMLQKEKQSLGVDLPGPASRSGADKELQSNLLCVLVLRKLAFLLIAFLFPFRVHIGISGNLVGIFKSAFGEKEDFSHSLCD